MESEDERQLPSLLLRLRHRDGWALGIIEAVHGAELHDHVQAVREHKNHEKAGHQTHPDSRRKEASTVAGVREFTARYVKALDLHQGRRKKKLF